MYCSIVVGPLTALPVPKARKQPSDVAMLREKEEDHSLSVLCELFYG